MLFTLKQQDLDKVESKFYGIGSEQYNNDCDQVLAKAVTVNGVTSYYCKFNTCGIEAGHLVNPWSMYVDEGVDFKNTVNPHTGKQLQEYKQVNETTFQLYTSYLTSRSRLHYHQAERMALHG